MLQHQIMQSQPSWAAWIEIITNLVIEQVDIGRSPLGLRGLKYDQIVNYLKQGKSQPSWAAWIEILISS